MVSKTGADNLMVRSVARALTILTSFSWEQQSLSLMEMSKILEIPKPTVYGLVATLTRVWFPETGPFYKEILSRPESL